MTPKALLQASAERNQTTAEEHAQSMLLQLCERLPITVLADMVAHTIATDEEGESESTSDFLYQVGKLRWPQEPEDQPTLCRRTEWELAIEAAKARYDTGYIPG